MSQNNYITDSSGIYFRHQISENLPPDTYSMHTHNVYELLYIVSGDVTHIIEDRKYKLKKGDIILIRPLHYHFIQIDSTTTYERYNILFDIERNNLDSARLLSPELEVISLAGDDTVSNIFAKCDRYRRHCDEDTFQQILYHLLSELFYYLALFPQTQPAENLGTSEMLSRALSYINENLYHALNISDVAKHLFVSESYLFRLFQKELHQTPRKYIAAKRLMMAQKRLNAGEKPTAVCEQCGFGDYTTFYRNYMSFFGHPPSEAGHNQL